MPGIKLREGDNVERALRALKKQLEKSGIMADLKKNLHYEKPSVRKKKKHAAARKRAAKQAKRNNSGYD